ncbi:fasciclin domain-containing protein [Tautonia rosea]|uniref:fasciclin domain-containing protein n=1 Tax=Tautonia rosea TaxID=2728037 RepID=UPI00147567EE|nr:fasciclin domain-containing protein [Tautonia rosea]
MLARFVAAPMALAALCVFPMGSFGPQAEAQGPPAPKGPTIVDIAIAVNEETGEFSTLIAALDAAGLVETLDGRRQFTVFAPTDAAFEKLGLNAGNIGTLPVEALTNILLYHVSPGERFAEDVVSSTRIRTLNKGFTFPAVTAEGVFINQSKILAVDIDASNGVIHVIDTVLLP